MPPPFRGHNNEVSGFKEEGSLPQIDRASAFVYTSIAVSICVEEGQKMPPPISLTLKSEIEARWTLWKIAPRQVSSPLKFCCFIMMTCPYLALPYLARWGKRQSSPIASKLTAYSDYLLFQRPWAGSEPHVASFCFPYAGGVRRQSLYQIWSGLVNSFKSY